MSRLTGLIHLIKNYDDPAMSLKELLNNIESNTVELDILIRKIVRKKTEEIDRDSMWIK